MKLIAMIVLGLMTAALAGGCAGVATPNGITGEHEAEYVTDTGVRVLINQPAGNEWKTRRPTELILYALPNGNSIEWTAGRKMYEGMDWHYDIQHIAAQTRYLRAAMPDRNVVTAYLEAEGKSWPAWRKAREYDDQLVLDVVNDVRARVPDEDVNVTLSSHSGGGSFITGVINSGEQIPDYVQRIVYLDSNYSYDNEQRHGEKLVEWLNGDSSHQLIVVAYDDRNIMFNGKKVVSDTGGTWRATHRMLEHLERNYTFEKRATDEMLRYVHPQIEIILHKNPDNKILHTVLVGEMNGFIYSMLRGTDEETELPAFGEPRLYEEFVEDYGPVTE